MGEVEKIPEDERKKIRAAEDLECAISRMKPISYCEMYVGREGWDFLALLGFREVSDLILEALEDIADEVATRYGRVAQVSRLEGSFSKNLVTHGYVNIKFENAGSLRPTKKEIRKLMGRVKDEYKELLREMSSAYAVDRVFEVIRRAKMHKCVYWREILEEAERAGMEDVAEKIRRYMEYIGLEVQERKERKTRRRR
jgi:hypothetical protein